MTTRKKLIEVALPLDAINKAAANEKKNPFLRGHPRSLHQWWARRPLVSARAVLFAQMVDDPSARPDIFKTAEAQQKERERLFRIIEELVVWENNNNEEVLRRARCEIWQSWRSTCAENTNHPRAKELFDEETLPVFHDPFAGGGTLPLEAQRLGLKSYASDLNPVAVLINKAMIEIPPRFAGKPPVNPESRRSMGHSGSWKGVQGLADDVRYYSQWMREEAEKRIGHLYANAKVSFETVKARPDLAGYVDKPLKVIAYLWARTVRSPNPAFAHVNVPLVSTFMLCTVSGKEAYIEPEIQGDTYRFVVKMGKPNDTEAAKNGTKLARANFRCLLSGAPIPGDHIKTEGKAGRMGTRLLAIVAEGERGRIYLSPTESAEAEAAKAEPGWFPGGMLVEDGRAFTPTLYGLKHWKDLFTSRQIVALTTFADLISEVRERVRRDAHSAALAVEGGGSGYVAYSDAIAVYLALTLDKLADYCNTICMWNPTNQNIGHLFTKQVIPMSWDFVEASPIFGGLAFDAIAEGISRTIALLPASAPSHATQQDCCHPTTQARFPVISTDPPYYDNVPYADLSDFFYVWLRYSLKTIFPDLFATLDVPKVEELVATPYRHGGAEEAEVFFLDGMTRAMHCIAEQSHPAFPVTIYYAFKQSENNGSEGVVSTGWETFLDAVIRAGFSIDGTWPMRTEREARSRGIGSNALASSIVLVCRPRATDAGIATRREFLLTLKSELPIALTHLQRGNIAPVDLAQAAIGPGMSVYTRYAKVLDAEGEPLTVRDALALINQTLDEALAEQEGDFDADSRWALAWFDQSGFGEGDFGVADVLARAKVTAVDGLVQAGIIYSKRGKVRLLKPSELPDKWDPVTDPRLTAWEIVHHLIRVLASGGENAAGEIVAKLGAKAESARELCYRLYTLCERKKRAVEALAYNGLVQSWPEITRLAREGGKPRTAQGALFGDTEE